MAALLSNMRNTFIAGFVLAALVFVIFVLVGGSSNVVETLTGPGFWQFIFRWLHVLFGILWIGILYYFNFVQIPSMPKIPDEQKPAMRERYPQVVHPVVCTHAETGRKHLYVNRFFTSHVVGMDADESRRLIDRLSRRAEIVEYQCRFHWEPNSIAFWDNRAVQHYASSDYWPERRVMERASIIGPRPVR